MRVLIVADVVGGVRTFVDELARGLAGLGGEVHLALLGRDAPAAARAVAASCEVRDSKLEWMTAADPWRDVEATGEWVEELRRRHRPDVIHMNTFAPVRDPDVPVLLTAHSCVLTWWRAVHGVEAPSGWARYRRLVRRAFERADAAVAPTRALLDDLTRVYGHVPAPRVIPNGRSIDARPDATRRERLVISVGRLWDEAKNAALVARAAPDIDGHVVLIGPGETDHAGVDQLGPLRRDEVIGWLGRAAVFAEPARYEPFGLAALEAALCGCALVLGDIPSLREVWDEAAAYVAPDDADGLAHAVNALFAEPDRCRRAAQAARVRARRYTPDAMARAYLDAYRKVSRSAVAA